MINIVVGENTDLMLKSIINLNNSNFKAEIIDFPETYKSNLELKKWFYEFLSKYKSDKEYYIYTHSQMIIGLMNISIDGKNILNKLENLYKNRDYDADYLSAINKTKEICKFYIDSNKIKTFICNDEFKLDKVDLSNGLITDETPNNLAIENLNLEYQKLLQIYSYLDCI